MIVSSFSHIICLAPLFLYATLLPKTYCNGLIYLKLLFINFFCNAAVPKLLKGFWKLSNIAPTLARLSLLPFSVVKIWY